MLLLENIWPEWTRLYWLFCAPIALILIWALQRSYKQQQDWHTILPKAFHAILLNEHAPRQRNIGYLLLAATWLCALLALLGPSWENTVEQPQQDQHFAPLVIAIQLTPDMLANDLQPSRLHHVREKVLSLLEQRATAFTALVVYAGSAHTLVPLSNDLLTSQNLLQALQPELMPVAGQRADLAIERAIQLLQQGAQGEGQILLISTGVSVPEQRAIERLLKGKPIQLKIIGVGSTVGEPIVESQEGHFLTDTTGAIIISRLNETSLQLLSKQTHSPYTQLSKSNNDLLNLDLLSQKNNNLTAMIAGKTQVKNDQGYWFIFPIVLIAAGFARRGSLLMLLVCLLPMPTFAFSLDNLWLRPDQQGMQLIEQQPAQAAERFTDQQWRATALYLAQDYQAAAQLFALSDTAAAHYNRGNALALAGIFEEALKAYQQALSQAPDMLAAQYNIAIIEEYLAALAAPDKNKNTNNLQEDSAAGATQALTSTAPPSTAAIATRLESQVEQGTNSETASTELQATLSSNSPAELKQPDKQQVQFSTPTTVTDQPIHLESWLEQIPDNPSELLKRKFWYEQSMQEMSP